MAEVIDGLGVRLDSRFLRYWDWCVTPVSEPRRYDTRFFVARLPADAVVTPHTGEFVERRGRWPRTSTTRHRPDVLHDARRAGAPSVDALLSDATRRKIAAVRPVLEGDEIGLPWGDRFPLPEGVGNA